MDLAKGFILEKVQQTLERDARLATGFGGGRGFRGSRGAPFAQRGRMPPGRLPDMPSGRWVDSARPTGSETDASVRDICSTWQSGGPRGATATRGTAGDTGATRDETITSSSAPDACADGSLPDVHQNHSPDDSATEQATSVDVQPL